MNQVYKTLPDDRPITSICVVEDADRCPQGYTVVSKTYDQDSDADLWRESGFFGRKCTRYLCLSKTAGIQDYAIESICIINEKEMAPQNYKTIPRTIDSEQKAWRKKQLCYKFAQVSKSPTSITDIIVLSRMKKAPEGFMLSGEINGMTLCYKLGKNMNERSPGLYPQVPYPISQGNAADNIRPLLPFRPAPKPPTPSTYATMSGYNGLEGVPFILNPKYNFSHNSAKPVSMPKPKSKSQVDEEYKYEFRTEHEWIASGEACT
ncbi:hypothetical protein RUM44_012505 [Polyplax serrata]|uniref:Multivesicular body subunit 12A n=1 Tax=Polyplax serrata TaxID=468196 RepID=A0ABR1BGD7_POLSC